MSAYLQIQQIARRQAALVEAGDLEGAVGLMDMRGEILAAAHAARPEDAQTIRETVMLDRALAAAIQRRMASLSAELSSAHRGRTALSAYRPRQASHRLGFDATR